MKEWSSFQQDIFNTYTRTDFNIVIGATAGSGKTTLLIELLKLTPYNTHQVFLAFNKSIKEEIEKRIDNLEMDNAKAYTLHSLGMRSLVLHFNKRLEMRENKIWMIAGIVNKNKWKMEKKDFIKTIVRITQLVDLYRMTLCQCISDIRDVALKLGVDHTLQELEYVIDVINEYANYNRNPDIIDYTDMVYIPATNNSITIASPAKVIYIDECQDLNLCQHKLVDKLVNQNKARWVAVGDKNQSIYGFSGAHSKSFDLFKDKDNVIEKPLSISYRCPKLIVDEANRVFEDSMEASPFAEDGEIVDDGKVSEIREGDMVLCRNLRPLIELFFKLIQRGRKCYIKGKDLGKGLVQLIKPFKFNSSSSLMIEMEILLKNKILELNERGIDNPKNHPIYIKLTEKINVISCISKNFSTTQQIIEFLDKIFSDDEKEGVSLSTIHKAKGLENQNVFFLNHHLIPSKYATTSDQKIQEDNLRFVAITRSQDKLTYLEI